MDITGDIVSEFLSVCADMRVVVAPVVMVSLLFSLALAAKLTLGIPSVRFRQSLLVAVLHWGIWFAQSCWLSRAFGKKLSYYGSDAPRLVLCLFGSAMVTMMVFVLFSVLRDGKLWQILLLIVFCGIATVIGHGSMWSLQFETGAAHRIVFSDQWTYWSLVPWAAEFLLYMLSCSWLMFLGIALALIVLLDVTILGYHGIQQRTSLAWGPAHVLLTMEGLDCYVPRTRRLSVSMRLLDVFIWGDVVRAVYWFGKQVSVWGKVEMRGGNATLSDLEYLGQTALLWAIGQLEAIAGIDLASERLYAQALGLYRQRQLEGCGQRCVQAISALPSSTHPEVRVVKARASILKAKAHLEMNEYDKAVEEAREAIEEAQIIPDHVVLGEATGVVSAALEYIGRPKETAVESQQILQSISDIYSPYIPNERHWARRLPFGWGVGLFLTRNVRGLGRPEDWLRVQGLLRLLSRQDITLVLLRNAAVGLAAVAKDTEEWRQVQEWWDAIQELLTEAPMEPLSLRTQYDFASYCLQKGDLEQAAESADLLVRQSERSGFLPGQLGGQGLAISVQVQQTRPTNELAVQAKHIAEQLHNLAQVRMAEEQWLRAGETYGQLEDFSEALQCYRRASDIVENVRGRMAPREYQRYFWESKTELYAKAVLCALKAERLSEALEFAERAKQRALIDLLGNRQMTLRETATSETAEEFDRISRQIDELRHLLRQRGGKTKGSLDRVLSGTEDIRSELQGREKTRDALWAKLRAESPEYASFQQAELPEFADITAQLPPGASLLEYYFAGRDLCIFLVTMEAHGQPVVRSVLHRDTVDVLQGLSLELAEEMATWEYVIGRSESGSLSEAQLGEESALSWLHDHLVLPVEEMIRELNSTTLYIVPHGCLHTVPFAALWNAARREYLGESFKIAVVPSASTLPFCTAKRTGRWSPNLVMGSASGVGPISEIIEHEAIVVAGLLGTQPITGSEATLERLEKELPNSAFFHFSGHGEFVPRFPLSSHISLTDGRSLSAYDIFGMRLDARSVVLSACETGKGTVLKGEEFVGLPRALIYAGTPSVLVSLWRVEAESTALLMEEYYQHSRRGVDKVTALHNAQAYLRTQNEFAHPYYWAGFVLVGDWL